MERTYDSDHLHRILEQAVRRGEAIRLRAERIEALRTQLWERIDRLRAESHGAEPLRQQLAPRRPPAHPARVSGGVVATIVDPS